MLEQFRKTLNHLRDRDLQARFGDLLSHDQAYQEALRLPDGEEIQACSVWAIEFYTPQHMPGLLHGLNRLGWDQPGSQPEIDPDIASWILAQREFARFPAWFSLGFVDDGTRAYVPGGRREAPLPEGINHLMVEIVCVSPSITALVVNFVFGDSRAGAVNTLFERSDEPKIGRYKDGYYLDSVFYIKKRALNSIREDWRKMALNWFQTNLPGVFCAQIEHTKLPVCELLSFKLAKPFSDDRDRESIFPDYLILLDYVNSLALWKPTEAAGFQFSASLGWISAAEAYAGIALREGDLPDKEMERFGDRNSETYARYVHSASAGTLLRWALNWLLMGFQREVSQVRDYGLAGSNPRRLLDEIRNRAPFSFDVGRAAEDMKKISEMDRCLDWEIEFQPADPSLDKSGTFREVLQRITLRRAEWLIEANAAMESWLSQYAALVSSIENRRLQEQMKWLTRALVIMTAVLLWEEILGLVQLIGERLNVYTTGT